MSERFEAHVERGHERLRAGDIEGAIDDYSEAVRLDGSNPTGWIARASALARKLDLDAAIADVRRALELAPADWPDRAAAETSLQRLEIKALTLPASIREFAARRKYRELTPEVIAGIPDDRLVQAVTDHVVDFRIRGDVGRQREILDGLPSGLRWFYAMWLVETEAGNGGFAQFFSQFEPFAEDALEGYRRTGSPRASLVKRAIAAKGNFGTLDREMRELLDDETARRVAFARGNPGLFN